MGAYYAYDFEFSDTNFNDYPKIGVWADGYYMSVNQFGPSGYAGVAVVAYEREAMLTGSAARQVKFDLGSTYPSLFAIQPSNHTGVLPAPAGSPNYFFAVEDDWFHGAAQDQVSIFKFAVDWSNPSNSSFTLAQTMPVASFDMDIDTSEIVQPNGVTLDSLRGFAMYRLNYRNLGDRGALVVNHSVDADGAGQAGVRWYEISIDNTTGDISLAQQGTYAPADGIDRWMGSAAMDAVGNIAIGFSATSNTLHPSVHYAGRLSTDPAGELTQGEGIIVTGTGSQGSVNRSRWADYSSLSVDPVDDCTFWYTTEYYQAADDNSLNWSTRIGSFKFDNCTALPTGFISGTVTDANTGEPIANLRVTAGSLSTRTDADGKYTLRLPVDTYDVSFSSYWYQSANATGITVTEDDTTNYDVSLTLAPTVKVTGTVLENGSHGWPVYSKVSVAIPDAAEVEVYTNPFTGEYEVDLVPGIAVPVEVEAVAVAGMVDLSATVTPADSGNGTYDQDFALAVDLTGCTAPGYRSVGLFQDFNGDFFANGWTTNDLNGSGWTWTSTANGRSNVTGGTGEAALIDSDAAGSGVTVDTELLSPVIAVAELSDNVLSYLANFQSFSNSADKFDLDIRVDGGVWQNVLAWTGDHGAFTGPGEAVSVDLTPYLTGATTVQLRFHYYDATWEWFAQVDDVQLGYAGCVAEDGTLYAGYVTDANTGAALNGVSIMGENSTVSFATAADVSANDGLYFLFEKDTTSSLTASRAQYETATVAVSPSTNMLARQDIALNAPRFEATPEELSITQTAGRSTTEVLSIENIGTASGEFNAYFVKGNSTITSYGPFHPSGRHFGPKDLNNLDASKIRYFPEYSIEALTPGELVGVFELDGLTFGWSIAVDRQTNNFWIGDLKAAGAPADTITRFDANGLITSDVITIDWADSFHADTAFNQRTGKLWSVNVGGDNCIYELDTVTLSSTGNKICPEFGVSQRGLAYDPVTDTFYSGSWNDSIIHQFTTDGTLIRSVNVGLAVAGLAFNAETQHLFISVNGASSDGDFDIVVVDAASPTLVKVGGYDVRFDIDGDGVADDVVTDYGQAGLDMDCAGNLWLIEQNQQYALGFDSGETGACEWNNVPWLSLSATVGDLAAGDSSDVDVAFNAAGMGAGTYEATIVYDNNSPYGALSVPVTMELTPPNYGSTQVAVTAVDVVEGEGAVITLERVGGSDFAVSVDYTTQDGSAVAGTDYTSTSGTVSWADMDTAPKTITIPTNTVDEHKTFTVLLSNPQGGADLGSKVATVVRIVDQPKGGGAMGVIIAFLSLLAVYRRKQKV
jgi:hypothetical protein